VHRRAAGRLRRYEAQDVVQEAFCRALAGWRRVIRLP
jgi:DNA-directed RNA polymerase specialized sigma24 family protein